MPLPIHSEVTCVAFSSDGKTLVAGRQYAISGRSPRGVWAHAHGDISFFDTASQTLRRTVPFVHAPDFKRGGKSLGAPFQLLFSRDGRFLMAAKFSKDVAVLDIRSGRWVLVREKKYDTTSKAAPDYLPIGFSQNGQLAIYAEQWRVPNTEMAQPDDKVESAVHRSNLVVCRTADGQFVRRVKLDLHAGEWPSHYRLMADDHHVIVATQLGTDDEMYGRGGHLIIFSLSNGQRVRVLDKNFSRARDLAISPDSSLVTMAYDDGIRLYSLNGKRAPILPPQRNGVGSVAFSSDNRFLAALDFRDIIHIIDLHSPTNTRIISQQNKSFTDCAFSPADDSLATIASSSHIKLWRVQ